MFIGNYFVVSQQDFSKSQTKVVKLLLKRNKQQIKKNQQVLNMYFVFGWGHSMNLEKKPTDFGKKEIFCTCYSSLFFTKTQTPYLVSFKNICTVERDTYVWHQHKYLNNHPLRYGQRFCVQINMRKMFLTFLVLLTYLATCLQRTTNQNRPSNKKINTDTS